MAGRGNPFACLFRAVRTNDPAECVERLTALDDLHRTDLYTALLYERLQRKCEMVREIFELAGQNWQQTFYTLLFRYMGDLENRETYMELSRRATYAMVLREKTTQPRIEALLFGTSGLLEHLPADDYIIRLQRDFDYLKSKYSIHPLEAGQWHLYRIRPMNRPTLRIAQLSAFLSQHDFVFEQVLACRTREEVYRLFSAEASQYWSAEPGVRPEEDRPRRVGRFKSDVFAINLVAILQYAYGSYYQHDELRDRALALLEAIPAESNRIVNRWCGEGLRPRNAFDTQALLQLSNEYCARAACDRCPLRARLEK